MHTILRQTVDLSLGHQVDAVAVQDRLSRACQGGGLFELERMFDRLADDRMVRVGRMELDLGQIGGDDWMAEFLRRLVECAERTLVQASADPEVAGRVTANDEQTGFIDSLSERSQSQSRFEALAMFLQFGRVPWWSDPVVEQTYVRDECAALTAEDKRSLVCLAARHPRVLHRLVIHLRAREVEQLLHDSLPPGLARRLAALLEQIELCLALPAMRISEWRAVYWRPFFQSVQEGLKMAEPETVVRHWFSSLEALLPQSVEKLHKRPDVQVSVTVLPRQWQQAFKKVSREAAAGRRRSGTQAKHIPAEGGADNESRPETHAASAPSYRSEPDASALDATQTPPLAENSPALSDGDAGEVPHESGTGSDQSPVVESQQTSTTADQGVPDTPALDAMLTRQSAEDLPSLPDRADSEIPHEAGTGSDQSSVADLQQASTRTDPDVLDTPALDAILTRQSTEGSPSLRDAYEGERSYVTGTDSNKLFTADNSYSLSDTHDGATLYVTGTGMVLLHPFLGELFRHLELVDEGQFVDEDARQIAVHVLGYLAFGSKDCVEADLILAKLLCGMPLDEVLLPVELSDAAIEAADELLLAVLKHWTALRSSSVTWLREQFFLRVGKLQRVDAGWKLVVESRVQDVLLSKLPWGFGVISLPWLDAMVHVSWGD